MRTRNTGTLKQIIEALGDHVPPDALAGEDGCFAGSECKKLRLDPGRFPGRFPGLSIRRFPPTLHPGRSRPPDAFDNEGETPEWLFFNKPGYAQWIFDNRIHKQEPNFDPDEGDYFREPYRRASNLDGIFSKCKERPVDRMALTTTFNYNELASVGFYCDECEHRSGPSTGCYEASLFLDAYGLQPWEQKMVLSEIKRHYIGHVNLTQAKMERFFHNDANFSDCTPGFFRAIAV